MSKYNPHIHHRRSIRLKGYDYAQAGLYFITICMDRLKNPGMMPFGRIKNGKMMNREWQKIPNRSPNTRLHEYIIMPNHFHAILEITDESAGATLVVAPNDVVAPDKNNAPDEPDLGQPQGFAPTDTTTDTTTGPPTDGKENKEGKRKTLGDMVGAFHSIVVVKYIKGVKTLGWPSFNKKLLQRNYYERIIRNEKAHRNISNYIKNNPQKWEDDNFNS